MIFCILSHPPLQPIKSWIWWSLRLIDWTGLSGGDTPGAQNDPDVLWGNCWPLSPQQQIQIQKQGWLGVDEVSQQQTVHHTDHQPRVLSHWQAVPLDTWSEPSLFMTVYWDSDVCYDHFFLVDWRIGMVDFVNQYSHELHSPKGLII